MRGLRTDQTTQLIIAGHALIQNLRRGHYELGLDASPELRVATALRELPQCSDRAKLDPRVLGKAQHHRCGTVPRIKQCETWRPLTPGLLAEEAGLR